MKRGIVGLATAVLALGAVLVIAAWAQIDKGAVKPATPGAPAPAAAESMSKPAAGTPMEAETPMSAPGMAANDFNIALPSGGTLLTPDSPNWPWKDVPEMAYHWYGGGGGIKEVLVHSYTFQSPVTQANFKDFTAELLKDFQALDADAAAKLAKDKAAQAKQALGMEKVRQNFILGDDQGKVNALWEVDGSAWNHLAVKDQRNAGQTVNYSILSTFYGNKVYTVTIFYLSDLNAQVKQSAQQLMSSFKVNGAMGPLGVEQTLPMGAMAPASSSTMPAGGMPTCGSMQASPATTPAKPAGPAPTPSKPGTPAPMPSGH